jgi:hypothetical protein
MPRSKCNQTIEHRLTLGTYERTELKKAVKAEKVKDYAQAAAMFTPIIGMAAMGAGVAFAGYCIAEAIAGLCTDGIPAMEFGDELDDGSKVTLGEIFLGRREHAFNNADGTTTTYKNHFAGIPLLGPTVSMGINLGRATTNATGIT